MKIFWENLTRYPRFLITSVSGLIIVLLNPLIKLAKKNKATQIFLLGFVFLSCFSPNRVRTDDLTINSRALYQLS